MKPFRSTRSKNGLVSSAEAIVQGLAPDGGLYCPQKIGQLDYHEFKDASYEEIALRVISALFPDFHQEELAKDIRLAYADSFRTDEITPLVKKGDAYYLELWHGPTCAFKDIALTLLPKLLKSAYRALQIQKDIVILTATSGDTGKAALEGFKDEEHVFIKVLYPHQMVSLTQEMQMRTTGGNNTEVLAVKGNFDDCQRTVKAIMENHPDYKHLLLSSANSINIGRLAPQVVYYFKAYLDLLKKNEIKDGEAIDFIVPTGNFGDILAGYLAKEMGLPVHKLICASNKNNVLEDFIHTGVYDANRPLYNTASPSIDILVSSNLERLLYLMSQDTELIAELMQELKEKRCYRIPSSLLEKIQSVFAGYSCSEEEVKKTIQEVYQNDHYLIDPHTAVAACALKKYSDTEHKHVVLSTASPYKFSAAVYEAITKESIPEDLDAMDRLFDITHQEIPRPLSLLKEAEIRFSEVLEKNSAKETIEQKLKEMDHD